MKLLNSHFLANALICAAVLITTAIILQDIEKPGIMIMILASAAGGLIKVAYSFEKNRRLLNESQTYWFINSRSASLRT